MPTLNDNKKLAIAFFRAMSSFDVKVLEKLVDPSITFIVPNCGCLGGHFTLSQVSIIKKIIIDPLRNGIKFEVQELTAENDRVSCLVDGYSQLKDGRTYNNKYHFLLRIKNGKIIETNEYLDSLLLEKCFSLSAQEVMRNNGQSIYHTNENES